MRPVQIIAAAFGVAALLAGCVTSPDDTRRSVEALGMTDVQVGGMAPFRCGEKDYAGRNFTARNSQGAKVSGVACCGLLKGCTVRW